MLQKRLYNLYEKKQKEKPKSISSNIPNNNPIKQNDFVYNFSEATRIDYRSLIKIVLEKFVMLRVLK